MKEVWRTSVILDTMEVYTMLDKAIGGDANILIRKLTAEAMKGVGETLLEQRITEDRLESITA